MTRKDFMHPIIFSRYWEELAHGSHVFYGKHPELFEPLASDARPIKNLKILLTTVACLELAPLVVHVVIHDVIYA